MSETKFVNFEILREYDFQHKLKNTLNSIKFQNDDTKLRDALSKYSFDHLTMVEMLEDLCKYDRLVQLKYLIEDYKYSYTKADFKNVLPKILYNNSHEVLKWLLENDSYKQYFTELDEDIIQEINKMITFLKDKKLKFHDSVNLLKEHNIINI